MEQFSVLNYTNDNDNSEFGFPLLSDKTGADKYLMESDGQLLKPGLEDETPYFSTFDFSQNHWVEEDRARFLRIKMFNKLGHIILPYRDNICARVM
jgi:hypothetical protein